ncbi:MFS transporter [Roseovarius salinarum]|uniref:MFS transporter n=1 Tax=Roseovarius salinarum TaxID=1981892 RepID=UPI000C344B92|nr:MFS transporter [Roseovarius salinarum]
MQRTLLDNWALFTGILMLMVANGLMMTLLTVRGNELGFSSTTIGTMQAGYPAGALLGTLLAPRLIAQSGHVRAFAALASLCSIAAIVHLMTADPVSWTAMRVLAGFCFPGLYVITESWLNGQAENRTRGQILSIYFFLQSGGQALGAAILGVPEASGTVLFGTVSILISLSIVPLLLTSHGAPDYEVPERMPLRRLFGISPMAVTGAFLGGGAMGCLFGTAPLYGLALGLERPAVAGIAVAMTLAGAAAQYPVGYVSDRIDRRGAVMGLSVIGVALVAQSLLMAGEAALSLRVGLMAAVCVPVYSVCLAHANDLLTRAQVVSAGGAMAFMMNAGIFVGIFSGPASMDLFGPRGFLLTMAAFFGATGLVALIRRSRTEAPEETGQAQAVGGFGQPQAYYLANEAMAAEDPTADGEPREEDSSSE